MVCKMSRKMCGGITALQIVSVVLFLCAFGGHEAHAHHWYDFENQITFKGHGFSRDSIISNSLVTLVYKCKNNADIDKGYEEILRGSNIIVQNGSLSHGTLLETLPAASLKTASHVAMRMILTSECVCDKLAHSHRLDKKTCLLKLRGQSLPEWSELLKECSATDRRPPYNHRVFRRLLPNSYEDSLYKMAAKQTEPRQISGTAVNRFRRESYMMENFDTKNRNLAFVQWAQFMEHDMSKAVATTMQGGDHIECCDSDNTKLKPRSRHPACAPLLGKKDTIYAQSCLTYVRSALAVDEKCKFGPAEQLNEATGLLDLSQLYGYVPEDEKRMRTYELGHIKSTKYPESVDDLLPQATSDANRYCSLPTYKTETCFMAGDTRVNSNPLSIAFYTIFMRSHNSIADKLHKLHLDWNDEKLFNMARSINMNIYHRMVFREWLPLALGEEVAKQITEVPERRKFLPTISNEFAVAAIRFYFSMMPNKLLDFSNNEANNNSTCSNDQATSHIFLFKDQMYRSKILSQPENLNRVLKSFVHQRAMKMDSSYENDFIQTYMSFDNPTGADVLAFDIQRGRDHGLQGYVRYLEVCQQTRIRSWDDLEDYMNYNEITTLMNIYSHWDDVDLIVGGILEKPMGKSVVGATFTCILGEQFHRLNANHARMPLVGPTQDYAKIPDLYYNGANLLCTHSRLDKVPWNIFQRVTTRNPLVSCADLRNCQEK